MSADDTKLLMIKESLHSIAKQLTSSPKARPSNEIKVSASKLYDILSQPDNPTEKFYFIYLVCQLCGNQKHNKVDKLMKIMLPSPATPQSMSLVSDLISFALCHPSTYSSVLDSMSPYLNSSDLINIDIESWQQAESLALDSPTFCSALISRPNLSRLDIDKKLLAKWLQDLSKVEEEFPPPSLNQLIRYSLFNRSTSDIVDKEELHKIELADSDLHFGILTLIQSKRCQTLTNQFLIEVATILGQQTNDSQISEQKHFTSVDCFAQILSVAAASKVTSITNTLRTILGKLDSNQLIASVIRWQNK